MSSHRAQPSPDPFLIAHLGETLTLFVLLFISLLSLAPYDFLAPTGMSHHPSFFTTTTSHVTVPDAIGNIALYVPMGFLLHIVLRRRIRYGFPAALATLLCATALSVGLEWLQAFSPSRVSSSLDVAANLMGATVGLAIAFAFGSLIPGLIGTLLFDLRQRPAVVGLKSYCGLLVVFAMMPFTFSFDAQRLATAYKESTFIPFATPPAERTLAELVVQNAASNRTNDDSVALLRWMVMRRWARWAAEAASFMVLALLMHTMLRCEFGFSCNAANGLAWWMGGLFALALSLLQLPVASRAVDATDMVFRLFGVACGLAVASSTKVQRAGDESANAWDFIPGLVRVGGMFTAVYVLYTGVIPLTFDFENGTLASAVSSGGFLPFTAYSTARHDTVYSDLTEKVAAFAVLAGLLAARQSRIVSQADRTSFAWVLFICMALSLTVELVQVFVPIRVPSLTDPMLAAFGCILGVGLQRTGASLLAFASENEMVDPRESFATSTVPTLNLTDQLMASLADPNPDAPVEAPPMGLPQPRE